MKPPTVQIRKGLIVIADDDEDVRELLAHRFAQVGYDVQAAASGLELLDVLARVQPTAIFVDLLMPGVLGSSILSFVAHDARLASVPIALVTGSPEHAPAGATVFVKPARFADLLEFVERAGEQQVIVRVARGRSAGSRDVKRQR